LEDAVMDYAQMQEEKKKRYEEYCDTYSEQLRLKGYIDNLEKDNENISDAKPDTFFGKRRAKKLIKINDKDIKMYKKALSRMPEVPEFK